MGAECQEEMDIMSEDVFKKGIRKGHIFYESGNSFFWWYLRCLAKLIVSLYMVSLTSDNCTISGWTKWFTRLGFP